MKRHIFILCIALVGLVVFFSTNKNSISSTCNTCCKQYVQQSTDAGKDFPNHLNKSFGKCSMILPDNSLLSVQEYIQAFSFYYLRHIRFYVLLYCKQGLKPNALYIQRLHLLFESSSKYICNVSIVGKPLYIYVIRHIII